MKDLIIQIGRDCDGTYLLSALRELADCRIAGVICTDDEGQVARFEKILNDEEKLAAGTSQAILEARTADCKDRFPTKQRSWELFKNVIEGKNDVTVIAIGSLTNLAIALMRYPDLREKIEEIVYLGGSALSGDVTAFAEKGIHDDPQAAKVIFESGIKIKMLGLDVTRDMSPAEREHLLARLFAKEEEFDLLECHVGIETVSARTLGMSVCDLYGKSPLKKNVRLVRAWKGETL